MLIDYHMHLQPDGVGERAQQARRWDTHGGYLSRGWIGRYVERARSRGVAEIAFTEHDYRFAALADLHPSPFWREEATADIDAYCAAIADARDAGMPVLLGIEADWVPGREDDLRAFLDARPFDVVLGSVHWIGEVSVDNPSEPPIGPHAAEDVWNAYLDALIDAAGSGLFDVLAHPDLPKVFGDRIPDAVRPRLDDLVDAVARAGIAVECSSAGFRKPVGELYPEPSLLAGFREAGVPVTLASDAHRPEDVAEGFSTAVAALRGAGYTHLTRFRGRVPEPTPIRSWA
ncbi:MAG: histidinol-phosphatase [Thermoleophilia bacterium]|nr:histidinol-phosphatase [Thermoleophilia bacterium]